MMSSSAPVLVFCANHGNHMPIVEAAPQSTKASVHKIQTEIRDKVGSWFGEFMGGSLDVADVVDRNRLRCLARRHQF